MPPAPACCDSCANVGDTDPPIACTLGASEVGEREKAAGKGLVAAAGVAAACAACCAVPIVATVGIAAIAAPFGIAAVVLAAIAGAWAWLRRGKGRTPRDSLTPR